MLSTRSASLDDCVALITTAFPDLAASRFDLLTAGWDCLAVDVDDRWIFKFPRHEAGRAALVREAGIIAALRGRVTMAVPDLALVPGAVTFSRHGKLRGSHLLSADYAKLGETSRDRLAADLALFFAELHAIDPAVMQAAGARPIKRWLEGDVIRARALPLLPAGLRVDAETTIMAWQALPPDPLGLTYGFFDGHGWNMAFDHPTGRLNGIYDFADSGFGDLHQEFVYPGWIAADLIGRVIARYETITSRAIDRERVHLLAAVLRLSELAEFADDADEAARMAALVAAWAATPPPVSRR